MLNGSWTIARVAGTEIRLHWSMLLLIPYVLLTFRPETPSGAVRVFLLVGLVFLFVLLHELGHTLAARLFGIRVPSVVLWPLGGAAMTEHEAGRPVADLVIAAAGPLVNVLLGVVLLVVLLVLRATNTVITLPVLEDLLATRSLLFLLASNFVLALTNLVPIYPLDGGRIFRALVQMMFGREISNQITFWLSMGLGLALLLGGLFLGEWLLVFTAVLLLAGAVSLNPALLNKVVRWYARLTRRPELFLRMADFDPALALINERIEATPRDPLLYLQRGYILFTLDEPLRALSDAERALQVSPTYLPALLLKGAAEYSLGNLTAARACVEQAEQLRPGWWLNALNSSIIERDQGHWEEAERDLGHAFDAFPNGGDASGRQMLHQARSVMVYRRGQMDQARQDWEQAYKSAPKDAAIFPTDRQRIFCQNWDWVMDYYAFLETKTPGSPVLPLMRGEMALRAERWQQAVDDFSVVITRQPALEDSCLFRGQAYEKLGQRERALDDYRRALRVTDRSHIRRLAQEGLRRLE